MEFDNSLCFKKEMSQCTFCQHLSSKAILYVCDSGHVLCGNCHSNSVHGIRLEDGDCLKCKRRKNHKRKKELCKFMSHKKDLASGDFSKSHIKPECENKDNETSLMRDFKNSDNIIVTYKNECYQDNKSDTSVGSHENSPKGEKTMLQECKPVSRPVACPVCAKMIAVDSILQHFFFDHSKVPRYSLKSQTCQHTVLKITDFLEGTNCLAVILVESGDSRNSPLLLMAAQMITTDTNDKRNTIDKEPKTPPNNRIKKTCHSWSSISPKNTKDPNSNSIENANKDMMEQETDLIMWLCKTVDTEIIYSLSVSREDKKMSFSFTGNAVHIRDDQNALNMFHKSECVIVRRVVAKKLINDQGNIHVFVTILHLC